MVTSSPAPASSVSSHVTSSSVPAYENPSYANASPSSSAPPPSSTPEAATTQNIRRMCSVVFQFGKLISRVAGRELQTEVFPTFEEVSPCGGTERFTLCSGLPTFDLIRMNGMLPSHPHSTRPFIGRYVECILPIPPTCRCYIGPASTVILCESSYFFTCCFLLV